MKKKLWFQGLLLFKAGVCLPIIWQFVCQKLHENEWIWIEIGVGVLISPLDLSLSNVFTETHSQTISCPVTSTSYHTFITCDVLSRIMELLKSEAMWKWKSVSACFLVLVQVNELLEWLPLLTWTVWCQLQITDIHDTALAYCYFELEPSDAQYNPLGLRFNGPLQ